jgi:hypothetical protein
MTPRNNIFQESFERGYKIFNRVRNLTSQKKLSHYEIKLNA